MMKPTLKQYLQNRRPLIDVLALFFGIAGFLGCNSLILQLPLLIKNAPEGWRLPTHMTMIMQLACIGPILYSIYVKNTSRKWDHMLIYGILGGGTASMFILAFLYEEISYIFGAERSTALLGFSFVQSLVSSIAPVLFMPYMGNYRDIYLLSYLVGEGISGFLTSALALIQGVGGNPQCVNATDPDSEIQFVEYYPDPMFSTTVFFILGGVIYFMSFAAFVALSNIPANSPERSNPPNDTELVTQDGVKTSVACETAEPESKMSRITYIYLLAIIWIISVFEYGTATTIQSYSCLPYGNVAYHLAVTLGFIANPLAMCVCVFFRNLQIYVISYLTAGIMILAAFLFYIAVMSPAPPLQDTWVGTFLVVASWIIVYGLLGFVRLSILTLFQPDFGLRLFYAGLVTLIGSLTGGAVSFCLVEFTGIFATYSPCKDYVAVEST